MKHSLFRLLVVAIISSAAFLILLQHRYDISISMPLIALAAIIVFMAVVYYIHALIPPYVVMKDTYMYRGLNDETADEWKYKDLSNCTFSSRTIDGSVSNTMDIETRRGERSHFTIPPEVSVVALRAFLREKGVDELG